MLANSSLPEQSKARVNTSSSSVEVEQAIQTWKKGSFLEKEDLILVLLLLASVAVCLLTVVGVVWG